MIFPRQEQYEVSYRDIIVPQVFCSQKERRDQRLQVLGIRN